MCITDNHYRMFVSLITECLYHWYLPFVVVTILYLPSWLQPYFFRRVTRRGVNIGAGTAYPCRAGIAQSLVFYIVLSESLSFCLFLLPLYCLSVDLRLLITLVFSIRSCILEFDRGVVHVAYTIYSKCFYSECSF